MPKFPVRSVIFDLDGTLIDTAGDLHAATNHTLKQLGRPTVTLKDIKEDVGYGALRMIRRGLERSGDTESIDFEAARAEFLDFYAQNIAVHSSLFSGGLEMLKTLESNGISMGICTNKPYELAVSLLEELNLSRFFRSVKGGDSYPFKKPDPRHIQRTAELIGEGPYIMIGDASPDILGAQAAGIPVIAAKFGYADVDLDQLNPDAVIQSLEEVVGLVVS